MVNFLFVCGCSCLHISTYLWLHTHRLMSLIVYMESSNQIRSVFMLKWVMYVSYLMLYPSWYALLVGYLFMSIYLSLPSVLSLSPPLHQWLWNSCHWWRWIGKPVSKFLWCVSIVHFLHISVQNLSPDDTMKLGALLLNKAKSCDVYHGHRLVIDWC